MTAVAKGVDLNRTLAKWDVLPGQNRGMCVNVK